MTSLVELRFHCEERLGDVLDLVEDYYVRGRRGGRNGRTAVRFPPHMWNVYKKTSEGIPRTNNIAKAWNRRWTTLVGRNHPNLYQKLTKNCIRLQSIYLTQIFTFFVYVSKRACLKIGCLKDRLSQNGLSQSDLSQNGCLKTNVSIWSSQNEYNPTKRDMIKRESVSIYED